MNYVIVKYNIKGFIWYVLDASQNKFTLIKYFLTDSICVLIMTFIVYGYNSYKYICKKWKIKILYEIPKNKSDNNIWVFNFFLKTIDWFIVFDSFLRVHKILSFYYKSNYSLNNKQLEPKTLQWIFLKLKKKLIAN